MINKRLFLAGIIWGVACSALWAEVMITDSFGSNPQRASGDKLNASATDSRNAKWACSGNLVVGEDAGKGCVMVTDNGPFVALLKIPEGYKTIRIEAEGRPQTADPARGGFMTIGVGKPPSYNISWLSGVYLTLDPKGHAAISIHPDPNDGIDPNKGASIPLKGLDVKSFKSGGMNKMVLEYDVVSNSVSAWVNDEQVADRWPLEKKSFTPILETMGFTGWMMKANEPLLTNFSVTLN